jgi:hypothetical protein
LQLDKDDRITVILAPILTSISSRHGEVFVCVGNWICTVGDEKVGAKRYRIFSDRRLRIRSVGRLWCLRFVGDLSAVYMLFLLRYSHQKRSQRWLSAFDSVET